MTGSQRADEITFILAKLCDLAWNERHRHRSLLVRGSPGKQCETSIWPPGLWLRVARR